MALACKCDRCGKLFESYGSDQELYDNVSIRSRYLDTGNVYRIKYSADLCNDCCLELILWANKYKKEESK